MATIIDKTTVLGAIHKLCHLGRGGGGSPKDDLVDRPYLTKKKLIFRQDSLWVPYFMDGPLPKFIRF